MAGENAHNFDEIEIEHLVNTSLSGSLPDGGWYSEGERAYHRVHQLLQENHAGLIPAVIAGARLTLTMFSKGQSGLDADQLDTVMNVFLTRGQWAEVILEDPEMPPLMQKMKAHEREVARSGEGDDL